MKKEAKQMRKMKKNSHRNLRTRFKGGMCSCMTFAGGSLEHSPLASCCLAISTHVSLQVWFTATEVVVGGEVDAKKNA